MNSKRCLICKPKNPTLYWHAPEDGAAIWVYCCKCAKSRTIHQYAAEAGIALADLLKGDIEFTNTPDNELRKMEWPRNFIPLSDPRADKAIQYLRNRAISPKGDMYYDIDQEGIVFPYYYDNIFVGAQIRFIEPRINDEGDSQKISTLTGTRLGLIVYGYSQVYIMPTVKTIIVTEGAFNTLSLQQSFDEVYGGLTKNPFKAIALSGSGGSSHHIDLCKDLIDRGYKVVVAPDTDDAGIKMLKKFSDAKAATHYAFMEEGKGDWNDCLMNCGEKHLAKYFLMRVTKF